MNPKAIVMEAARAVRAWSDVCDEVMMHLCDIMNSPDDGTAPDNRFCRMYVVLSVYVSVNTCGQWAGTPIRCEDDWSSACLLKFQKAFDPVFRAQPPADAYTRLWSALEEACT